ncbi:hypothetical protein [Mesoterricola silvestris]|uniref:Uncharacterized protein n=1 Tax=Mesoterricola silvestris TaxID=2927979 RepID=A0AA48H8T5_9BACT|nr:hypothetical protein [Mesoterricola silvestris]BDU73893.1 hypothetical protein METEAL_30670 [Mesoterricola silvestris]
MQWISFPHFLPVVWLLSGAVNVWAGCGETLTVENKLGTRISPGWVITGQSHSGPDHYSPHFPAKHYLTLVNLNGAPVGTVIEVLGFSPIPPGWAKTATWGAEDIVERTHFNLRHRIEKQFAADYPLADQDTPPVIYGEVEFDIASIDWKRSDEKRKREREEAEEKAPTPAGSYMPAP